MRATWGNACCHVGRVARTEIAVRIVVSGSVVYRRAPTLFVPFPSTPPTSHPHGSPYPPRNRETSKLHAGKAVSSYLLDSRVATAPLKAPRGISLWETAETLPLSHENTRLTPRKTHRDQFLRPWTAECDCMPTVSCAAHDLPSVETYFIIFNSLTCICFIIFILL